MDDRHILAEIERSLTRTDPELAARITRLSRALDQSADTHAENSAGRDAIIPIMVVIMFIVAIAAFLAVSAAQQPTAPEPTGNPPPVSEPVQGQ
jgi:hypothetical protein